MTIDEIRTKVREITNTTTADYSDASLVRDLNAETVKENTFIRASRGPQEFDDPNQTDYSFESAPLDGVNHTFDVQTDEHSENIYAIQKVIVNGVDIPRLAFEGDNQDAVLDPTATSQTPNGFFDLGKAIRFTEIPDSGTATIYYDRQHHYIETGDTSMELGLPRAYHPKVCYSIAYNYALDKMLPNLESTRRRLQEEKTSLEWYEENRRGDEAVVITVESPNGL